MRRSKSKFVWFIQDTTVSIQNQVCFGDWFISVMIRSIWIQILFWCHRIECLVLLTNFKKKNLPIEIQANFSSRGEHFAQRYLDPGVLVMIREIVSFIKIQFERPYPEYGRSTTLKQKKSQWNYRSYRHESSK